MGSGFESGKENFQMKVEVHSDERIHAFVRNNRDRISRSMLEPEFLDILVERFLKEDSVVGPEWREEPPFSNQLLTYIALDYIHSRGLNQALVHVLLCQENSPVGHQHHPESGSKILKFDYLSEGANAVQLVHTCNHLCLVVIVSFDKYAGVRLVQFHFPPQDVHQALVCHLEATVSTSSNN